MLGVKSGQEDVHMTLQPWVDAEPGVEQQPPIAEFERYHAICDISPSYRGLGLRDSEAYAAAVEDPRTLFCNFGSVRLPVLVPIEYEQGYDEANCKALTDRQAVMLLTIPVGVARRSTLLRATNLNSDMELPDEFAIVVEESRDELYGSREEDRQEIADLLSALSRRSLEPEEFTDNRLAEVSGAEANRTAWMGLFSSVAEPTAEGYQVHANIPEILKPSNLYYLHIMRDGIAKNPRFISESDRAQAEAHLVDRYIAFDGDPRKLLLPDDYMPVATSEGDSEAQIRRDAVFAALRIPPSDIERLRSADITSLAPRSIAQRFALAWQAHRLWNNLPAEPSAESKQTYLYTPDDLRTHPEIMNSLWAISEAGFNGFLGNQHPVSMAETREFFDAQLMSPSTVTVVRFDDGRPVCFGSMSFDPDESFWMNANAGPLYQELRLARENGQLPLFFSEIISEAVGDRRGASYSAGVLSLIASLGAITGNSYRIMFESTNMSAMYIPPMVEKLLRRNTLMTFPEGSNGVQQVAALDYWYVRTKRPSDE